MKVDVYKSQTANGKYVAVPAGQSPAQAGVTDPDFSNAKLFKTGADVEPDKNLVGVSSKQVIADIQSKGHSIFSAGVTTRVSPN